MSSADRAALGGIARAKRLSPEERQAIGRRGGEATLRLHGTAGMKLARKGIPYKRQSSGESRDLSSAATLNGRPK